MGYLKMNTGYLSSFKKVHPNHEIAQKDCHQWIAHAHSSFEARLKDLSKEEEMQLHAQIQEKILSFGLGPDKISQRGIQMPDIWQEDIETRTHFSVSSLIKGLGLSKKMEFFNTEGLEIFKKIYAARDLPPHIVHVSCTGYVAPSPAQRIVSELEAKDTVVTHSYHMGCYGAFPAIRIALGSEMHSDVVHTEFCTLHMNPANHSKEQLLIESLFADGFIKYTVSREYPKIPSLQTLSLKEVIIPGSMDSMQWICQDWGFGMKLSRDVPAKIAKYLIEYLTQLASLANIDYPYLLRNSLFAIHPGGPKIIQQIQERLGLDDMQIRHTKKVLFSYGNMSSATLPHVWQEILNDPSVKEGALMVSMAFGPGLTISGGIFQKKG
ncbi:MAG: hypothetical protein EBZ47_07590 [Chlamydiae bacterium]|nr:hypothetical protein [Chlamydiota bacterium]